MAALTVIPHPLKVDLHGTPFALTPEASVVHAGGAAGEVAELLAAYLRPATGFPLPVRAGTAGDARGGLFLQQTGESALDDAGFADEAYTLTAAGDGVCITATTDEGLTRGTQTLRQLFPAAILAPTRQDADWTLPGCTIEDRPMLRWRGLHLDVCRHFFTSDEVKRFIDLAALHQYNVVHLHLTEDQGWRMEIERYPRLTEVGAWRNETLIGSEWTRPRVYDGTRYGGFYTKAELRELVAFAAARRVRLVPEVDMPGHMQAAVAAYPELGNTDQTLRPRCHWGISHHILNVEDATIRFCRDVRDGVMDVFPSRFVHIGGDEAEKQEWKESKRAQERMRELGLKSEEELQSWFIRQMAEHIDAAGRRCIGWDEILEGGLAPGAAVMSWRGEEGGLAAAAKGHDVVMAPSQWVYFDHYQREPQDEEPLAIGGLTTTEHVYNYRPVPEAMPGQQRRHVLGAQGQLWSEYIPDQARLDYMTYPRACALAEVLWLPRELRKASDFLSRLDIHRARLSVLGVNAHPRP
ncbi:MAG: beta-N-acetylhexosaminidase [Planctomycetota bacterium]